MLDRALEEMQKKESKIVSPILLYYIACMWWFSGVSEQDVLLHLLFLFMLTLCARLTSYRLKNKWHPFCSNLAALMNLRAFTDHCFSWTLITTSESIVSPFFPYIFSALILCHRINGYQMTRAVSLGMFCTSVYATNLARTFAMKSFIQYYLKLA